jgi:hypothetical protein
MLHDASIWQVGVLGGVLGVGIVSLDFPLSWGILSCTLVSGILGEYGLNTFAFGDSISSIPRIAGFCSEHFFCPAGYRLVSGDMLPGCRWLSAD